MAGSLKRVVTGDTPEHGKHLLVDSNTGVATECNGGLAFALGVAVMEAEISREANRFWQVCHPNGAQLYHVMWLPSSQVLVTKVC